MAEHMNPEDTDPVEEAEQPSWAKKCPRCNAEVSRWPGQGDVYCPTDSCTVSFNASGQQLRDDWAENPAWDENDDRELGDLEGYELQQLARDTVLDQDD